MFKSSFLKLAFRTLLLILFVSAAVLAQGPTSKVSITVKDSNGAAIPNAQIELTIGSVALRSMVSDANGVALLDGLKPGNYRLLVSAEGFTSSNKEVALGDQANASIDVVLTVGGVSETVTVTATRTQVTSEETAVPVSVIGRQTV